ncbi:unnamed protein product [Echinostoma caproni]|uniref:PDZ domain-containing protein n=1 Tax=Echinostoma caproni TaxID=27848 RepID=A0A183A7Q9_9TREM|nr:unnamed protein product [Echinostoma caproni]
MLASYGSLLLPSLWNAPVTVSHALPVRNSDVQQLSKLNRHLTNGLAAAEDLDRYMWHDLILETALSSCEDSGIDLFPGGRLSDLEYTYDIVLLNEDPGKLQAFLDSLSASVAMFCDYYFPERPRRAPLHPLQQNSSNGDICGSWYYLFGRPSSYNHHMLALNKLPSGVPRKNDSESLRSSNGVNDTNDSAVADTSKLDSPDSHTTALSLLDTAMEQDTNDAILRFLIPYSEEGYGFTLADVEHSSADGSELPRPTSTPSASPESGNRTRAFDHHPSNIYIHAVRKSSPADQVNLPVGAYLVEIGCVPLGVNTTLKEAVKRLRHASKLRTDKSMPLGVTLTRRMNASVPRPVTNGGSKNDDCLSVISSISGTSHEPVNSAQKLTSLAQNETDLMSSPLATSFRSFSVSASSVAWSGSATYPYYASLHRSSPAGVNGSSGFPAEVTSLRSVGLSQLSSGTCALLCEERCIDPETESCNTDGENSLQRRKRLLTLAHPVLNLRWSEVTPQEAKRQWAIAVLLTELDRVANDLLAGVRAYRLGLRRSARLTKEQLELLFRNITQVASQAWRLVQRLKGSCLAYANVSNGQPASTPVRSHFGTIASKPSGITVSQTIPTPKETRKPSLFTRIRKSIVNNQRTAQNATVPSITQINKETSVNLELSTPNTITPFTQPEPAHFDKDDLPVPDQQTRLDPPPHGHLDCPGRIVHGSIGTLLTEYAVYTHEHLTRMKQVREFRRHHPELRSLLRAHAMSPGVPSFTNFLALPLELLLILLIRLQKIQEYTSDQHTDRPFLDSSIAMLREAVLSPSTTDGPAMLRTPHASRTGTLQESFTGTGSHEENIRSNERIGPEQQESPSSQPDSQGNVLQSRIDCANRELVQLFRLVQPPLHASVECELSNEPEDWINSERYIIFRGAMNCVLSNIPSAPGQGTYSSAHLYTGKVFAYLLTDALVLVASDTDVLVSNESKPLLCEPVLLTLVCNQSYGTELHLTMETIGGLRLQLTCPTVEDKVVWKTLIQQRIAMIQ